LKQFAAAQAAGSFMAMLQKDFTVAIDYRGEEFVYTEGKRSVRLPATWSNGVRIYPKDMPSRWTGNGDKPTTPNDQGEIIARIVLQMRDTQGMDIELD
jgi:hypothetical protein